MTWFGHPGDSPQDVRARPMLISWDPDSGTTPGEREDAIRRRLPVYRWYYRCNGIHNQHPPGDDLLAIAPLTMVGEEDEDTMCQLDDNVQDPFADGEDADTPEPALDNSDEREQKQIVARVPRSQYCPDKVRLRVSWPIAANI